MTHLPAHLDTLGLAIARSRPPTTMPGYWRQWRTWWRVALALMRQAGIRDRAMRDAVHSRLVSVYQSAALRESEAQEVTR